MTISRWQLKTARVSLGLSVNALAKLADVAPNSIWNIEDGKTFKSSTMEALQAALEEEGALFAQNRVGVKMVWHGERPATRETRDAVLAVLNAGRAASGQTAPLIDVDDED